MGLVIGESGDIVDEILKRYYGYLTNGTVVEGFKLDIERIPFRAQCTHCKLVFRVDFRIPDTFVCPDCEGSNQDGIVTLCMLGACKECPMAAYEIIETIGYLMQKKVSGVEHVVNIDDITDPYNRFVDPEIAANLYAYLAKQRKQQE